MSGPQGNPSEEQESLKARVFGGQGWNKAYVEGALIHDLWAEIERLTRQRDSFEHQVDLKNEGLREQRGEIERLRRELNNAINELTARAING